MKPTFFQKRTIGLSPLASIRDWGIVLGLLAGILLVREALRAWTSLDKLAN